MLGRVAAPSRARPSSKPVSPAERVTPPRAADPDGGRGDLHEVLIAAVDEAARLLDADGAMVYLMDPASGRLRFAHDAGIKSPRSREWVRSIELEPGTGMFGHAVGDRTVAITGDYPNDTSFRHADTTDRVVADIGIRSMVVAPMASRDEVFGALGTFSSRVDAFDDAQIGLVRSLADHAAAAMANARLIEELGRSRTELAERAEAERRLREALSRRVTAEQALREIGARITALRDQDEILQDVVEQASRLVRGKGAILDLLEPGTSNLRWAFDDGLGLMFSVEERAALWISVGVGATGIAVAQDRVVIAGDDLASQFPPSPESTEFYERTGFRSMIVAPITGEDGPMGVIEVYDVAPNAFDESDGALVQALASQAAIAITNARLIAALASSKEALARTADAERTLREIAAQVAALHDQDEILQAVVDAATRLMRATGAMIDLVGQPLMAGAWTMSEDSRIRSSRAFMEQIEVDPEAGVSGLAITNRRVESTSDYLADARFRHTPERDDFARHVGIRSVMAAPLLQGDLALGAITVYSDRGDGFDDGDAAILAGLADQAASALTNSILLDRLTRSEARFRGLVQSTPDLIWSIDGDAKLTFLSDAIERLTGFTPAELIGQHFGAVVHESSRDVAQIDWTAAMVEPSQVVRGRLDLLHRDGHGVPAEFIAVAMLDGDGRFAGANGSVRDMREQDRLERELRESEERYRFLVEQSPDIVFATDAVGRFTYLSSAIERMTGYQPDEVIGQHFSVLVDESSMPIAADRWAAAVATPAIEVQADLVLTGKDGRRTPVDVRARGVTIDGEFTGIQGATRDVSDQVSLETELRRQAGELAAGEERAHLARELHDSVTQALFSMTLVSRSVELLLDRDQDAARDQLSQLRELQREALAEMRALIFELRPGNIEQDGLVRALRTHTAALQGRIGLPIVVESDLDDRLPLEVEEVLYRIAQEALHNVVKHANARQTWLDLRRMGPDIRLRIEDDGKGFDPTSVPDGHLGLAGMRARADRLGARFSVDSAAGAGTRIEVRVPAAMLTTAESRDSSNGSDATREA